MIQERDVLVCLPRLCLHSSVFCCYTLLIALALIENVISFYRPSLYRVLSPCTRPHYSPPTILRGVTIELQEEGSQFLASVKNL